MPRVITPMITPPRRDHDRGCQWRALFRGLWKRPDPAIRVHGQYFKAALTCVPSRTHTPYRSLTESYRTWRWPPPCRPFCCPQGHWTPLPCTLMGGGRGAAFFFNSAKGRMLTCMLPCALEPPRCAPPRSDEGLARLAGRCAAGRAVTLFSATAPRCDAFL